VGVGRQLVGSWSAAGRQLVGSWSAAGRQLVSRSAGQPVSRQLAPGVKKPLGIS